MSSTALRPLALASVFACLLACDNGLPTQPVVGYGEGVTIYPDSLFRGERVTLGGDVADLSKLRGPCAEDENSNPSSSYDDCVSSLRVPDGWSVTVFRDRDFKGASVSYTADVPDLDMVPGPCNPGFNDCISSMRVFRR